MNTTKINFSIKSIFIFLICFFICAANLFANTNSWQEVKKLTAFGRAVCLDSVAVDGDIVVVGAYEGQEYSNPDGGVAYVFERNEGGINASGKVTKLIASDGQVSNRFGYSIALAGDVVIVGAPHVDINVNKAGAAYVFERNARGMNNWGEVIKLTAFDVQKNDQFGYSVAMAGDIAIVGAPFKDGIEADSGQTYVFERNAGGYWGKIKILTPSDAQEFDLFGISVAVVDDIGVVGALFKDGNEVSAGAAYIFQQDVGGANAWGQVKKLTASDGQTDDYFGDSIAVTKDVVIVGATHEDSGGNYAGAAYVFDQNFGGLNAWGEVKKLTCPNAGFTAFGTSVDVADDVIVVGAGRLHSWYINGAAYLFERNAGGANAWGEVQKLTATDHQYFSEYFSGVVAIDGKQLVNLGHIYENTDSVYCKVAYVYSVYGPLPSDIFASANSLENDIGIAEGNNAGATIEPGEPQHAGNGGPYHSVWWNWSDSASASPLKSMAAGDTLLVDTHGSDFDTVLAVYTGSAVNSLTQVAANDNSGPGVETSEVSFQFNSGVTYHIAVDGKTANDTGNIVLNYAVIPEFFYLRFEIFYLLFAVSRCRKFSCYKLFKKRFCY